MRGSAAVFCTLVLGTGLAMCRDTAPTPPALSPPDAVRPPPASELDLVDIDGEVDALRARFNADRGKVRLLVILSPT